MSLKPFHIVLISSGIALGIGMGFWSLRLYQSSQVLSDLTLAAGGFAVAGLLAAYLVWFLRKMKERGW